MGALQHLIHLAQTGGGADGVNSLQEGVLLGLLDLGAAQGLQDAHADLIVVSEDIVIVGQLLHGLGVDPVDEQLLAGGAAPTGGGGVLDGGQLLLSPAVGGQGLGEALVAHLGHRGGVADHDVQLVAGLQAVLDEALCGGGADALVVALDVGDDLLLDHGVVNDAVHHDEGDIGGGDGGHGGLHGVVVGQDHDASRSSGGGQQVVNLLLLILGVGGGLHHHIIGALGVDLLGLLLGVVQHGTGPAVVGVGDQDVDVAAGSRGGLGLGGGGGGLTAAAGGLGGVGVAAAASQQADCERRRREQCKQFLLTHDNSSYVFYSERGASRRESAVSRAPPTWSPALPSR